MSRPAASVRIFTFCGPLLLYDILHDAGSGRVSLPAGSSRTGGAGLAGAGGARHLGQHSAFPRPPSVYKVQVGLSHQYCICMGTYIHMYLCMYVFVRVHIVNTYK